MKKLIILLLLVLSLNPVVGQENISLITPFDGDTIETKNPLLSWSYLGGFDAVNDRTFYRLLIVELEEQQSAEAGIIVNQPLVRMDNLTGAQYFYPYDAPELEEGHRYGWQIQKISNDVIVDKSEAWEFILPLPVVHKPQYFKLKAKSDGTIYRSTDGKIYFYFKENYNQQNMEFQLYDDNNEQVNIPITLNPEAEENEREINVKGTGGNFFEVDLGGTLSTGIYKLIVQNAKKQKFQMKFSVN